MNQSKKLYNGTVKAKQRREKVILRLEQQLTSGQHRTRECKVDEFVLLSDSDKIRVKKELATLKARV